MEVLFFQAYEMRALPDIREKRASGKQACLPEECVIKKYRKPRCLGFDKNAPGLLQACGRKIIYIPEGIRDEQGTRDKKYQRKGIKSNSPSCTCHNIR